LLKSGVPLVKISPAFEATTPSSVTFLQVSL
jgi:hypothetical protein